MLGLKVKQKVYIIQYGNCIPVFVHVGSHLGRDKTIQKISSRFLWKNINEDIRIFVQHCDKCQRTNAKFSKSNAKLHLIVPMPNVWHGDLFIPKAITPSQDRSQFCLGRQQGNHIHRQRSTGS